jgi:hypothetical protein
MKRLGLALAAIVVVLYVSTRVPHDAPPPPREPASAAHAPSTTLTSSARTTPSATNVFGRLVDAEGFPFAHLRVSAFPEGGNERAAETDDAGTFRFDDLPASTLELDLSAAFDPKLPLGERALACAVPRLKLDLHASAGTLDAGTHVLPRSRPYWIEGVVELDETWARSKEVTLSDVRLEVDTPSPDDLIEHVEPVRADTAATDWRAAPWRSTLPTVPPSLAPDATFRFAVETPHDPLLLRVRLKRLEPFERVLTPTPDGVFSETFRFPQ